MARSEDVLGPEDFDPGMTKEERFAKIKAQQKVMFDNEPRIKFVLKGLFDEMIDRGVMKLE